MPRAMFVALPLLFAAPASALGSKLADPAPLNLTSQQDHKLMMEALKFDRLRPGANGMSRDAPNAANDV